MQEMWVQSLGKSSGEENGNLFQCSCLGNPMDGAACGLQSQSQMQLSDWTTTLLWWNSFCMTFWGCICFPDPWVVVLKLCIGWLALLVPSLSWALRTWRRGLRVKAKAWCQVPSRASVEISRGWWWPWHKWNSHCVSLGEKPWGPDQALWGVSQPSRMEAGEGGLQKHSWCLSSEGPVDPLPC